MRNSDFLQWLHNRIVNVYNVNENYDYMHKLRELIAAEREREEKAEARRRYERQKALASSARALQMECWLRMDRVLERKARQALRRGRLLQALRWYGARESFEANLARMTKRLEDEWIVKAALGMVIH